MDKDYIKNLLECLNFKLKDGSRGVWIKNYSKYLVEVDLSKSELKDCKINYGSKILVHRNTTTNFSNPENLVVLECVNRLLEKGYSPERIELEKGWKVGGFVDIFVKDNGGKGYLMIECKQYGSEYDKAIKILLENNFKKEQLFNYFLNDKNVKYLALYSSILSEGTVYYRNDIISTDQFQKCKNQKEIYDSWDKTFNSKGIFEEEISPYNIKFIGLRKKDLKSLSYDYLDYKKNQGSIYNRFAEILRRHTVSDKNNAYNKIFNLFLCKIVDEDGTDEDEELSFQWNKSEEAETVLLRLNDLYKKGMKEYLKLEVADVTEDEFESEMKKSLVNSKQDFSELRRMFKLLRLYKDNEFAFKEVIDQRTFLENAEVVKEVVKLLEPFRIKYTHKFQFLGDFFERLLNIGIKQESGQFFTPLPIATFITNSLDFEGIINNKISNKESMFLPYVIDYACGSGHFLTESMDRVDKILKNIKQNSLKTKPQKDNFVGWSISFKWAREFIYGIENDYRLAKTTKVASFLNGDGDATVLYADGLDSFSSDTYSGILKSNNKSIDNPVFDVVVANPPYSVEDFKFNLTNGDVNFELFDSLGDKSDDIECIFIERTKQLLKEGGFAGIILPSTILLNKGIHQKAREFLIKHFEILAISEFGGRTFAATGQNTVVLFLKKRGKNEFSDVVSIVDNFFKTKKEFDFSGKEKVGKNYLNCYYDDISLSEYFSSINNKNIQTEKKKLINFLLTFNQTVVISNSGKTSEEEKLFLGYEHSDMRKYEGIHPYPHNDEGRIISKLYNEKDPEDKSKISYFILSNFKKKVLPKIPDELSKHLEIKTLSECIDFSNKDFDCKIYLQSLENVFLKSNKYPLVALSSKVKGASVSENLDNKRKPIKKSMRTKGKYPYYGASGKTGNIDKFIFDEKLVLIGEDGAKWGAGEKTAYVIEGKSWVNNHAHVIRPNQKLLVHEFLVEIFNRLDFAYLKTRPNGGKLQKGEIEQIKFPLPNVTQQQDILMKISQLKGTDRIKKFDQLLGL